MQSENRFEVVIIGGGPAGQSAALILGRSCRNVVVIDAGAPRNRFAENMHGFLTRDGISPIEFLEIAKQELTRYAITWHDGVAERVEPVEDGFRVFCRDGKSFTARKILVTTGVVDRLPPIDGIEQFYGDSIHHCPYCHGWEVRDQAIAVYGKGKSGASLSLSVKNWSEDVMLFTDGDREVPKQYDNLLAANNVHVETAKIEHLEGSDGKLAAVVLEGGRRVRRTAMFFTTGNDPQCDIPRQLGCEETEHEAVRVNHKQETNVSGVYMAGDAAWDMQLVIVAAAEGAKAGVAINTALQEEDRLQPRPEKD